MLAPLPPSSPRAHEKQGAGSSGIRRDVIPQQDGTYAGQNAACSAQASSAKQAMLLMALELGAMQREGSAWCAPPHLGSFTVTKMQGQ